MTERIGAVVLAGGKSSRFGRDKLAELIDGRSMLDRAIEAAQAVASDVVVVVAPDAERPLRKGTRIAHDTDAYEGPLAGLAVGLAALDDDVGPVVVVGGDMPFMVPAVLAALVELLGDGVTGTTMEARGGRRHLPMAVDRLAALACVATILSTGERRLGWLRNVLEFRLLPERRWRELDPKGATLRDVDLPGDLPG